MPAREGRSGGSPHPRRFLRVHDAGVYSWTGKRYYLWSPHGLSPHGSYPGPQQGVPASVVVGCSGLTLCGRVFECRGPVRAVPISERSQRRQRPRFPCTERPPCTERLARGFRSDITISRSARNRSGSSLTSLCVSSSRSCTPGSATGRAPRAHQPEAGAKPITPPAVRRRFGVQPPKVIRLWRPADRSAPGGNCTLPGCSGDPSRTSTVPRCSRSGRTGPDHGGGSC